MKFDDIVVGQWYWVQFGEGQLKRGMCLAKPTDAVAEDGGPEGQTYGAAVMLHKVAGPVIVEPFPWAAVLRVAYDVLCWAVFAATVGFALFKEWTR
jgi:hypothetical protein